ncbi:Uncharacterised protein [Vibrio cholerae]|nr:Uncharacterised protein [Vibrio cholerae]CSC86119.1 Uncharacterised protein [Vibrio cholerae]CSI54450.1 Uncharacterised protein [Vibrio cholerae]CSI54947.1 Uncharacterised protein [Vibrio cholerae]
MLGLSHNWVCTAITTPWISKATRLNRCSLNRALRQTLCSWWVWRLSHSSTPRCNTR